MKSNNLKIERHSPVVRFIHWTVTVSIFLLIFTGIGQMPVYRRYMVDQLPGLAWSSDFSVTLTIHYLAAMALIFASLYHVIYHGFLKEFDIIPRRGDIKESYHIIKAILTGSQEPPSHKYLAEQRLAYVFILLSVALTIVTGVVKVMKNMPSMHFSNELVYWMTTLHNIGTFMVIFGIAAHLGAFVIKENRNLLPSMFTGKVDLCYIKHRHQLWYEDLVAEGKLDPRTADICVQHNNKTKNRAA